MKTVTTKDELVHAVQAGTFPFQLKIDGEDFRVVRRGHTDPRNAIDLIHTANNRTFAFAVESDEPEVHEVTRDYESYYAQHKDHDAEGEEYIDNTRSADGKSVLAIVFGGRYSRPLFQ